MNEIEVITFLMKQKGWKMDDAVNYVETLTWAEEDEDE